MLMRIAILSFCLGIFLHVHGMMDSSATRSIRTFRQEIAGFTKQKGLDQEICFIVDLSQHNGKKRFFVYNMKKDSILDAGLVAHGNCMAEYLPEVQYSNVNGSQCSSFGRYKVGMRYTGQYGKAFKLHGLDSTNSLAFERSIVIHAKPCIPETESYPQQICNSQGCPSVAPGFLNRLDQYITKAKKPILLWVMDPRP